MASLKETAIKQAITSKNEAKTIKSLSEQADEDLPMSPGDKLCEDELTVVFSSYWISTKDLLNFRFVNKSWRDAATTTLLQRDVCYVILHIIPTVKAGTGAGNEVKPCGCGRGEEKAKFKTAQSLTELMSNSPRFPVSNFRIHACHLKDYAHSADLVMFFKLHGGKVKTLGTFSHISQQQLLNICFTYAPTLECLDLSCAGMMRVSLDNQDSDERIPSNWTSNFLPFKSIIFGRRGDNYTDYNAAAYHAFLHLLLSSRSNLSRIHAKVSQIAHVLEEGKGDLIRSLHFYDDKGSASSIALVKKYLELNPKLSQLSLDLSNFNFEMKKRTLAPLNALIESSRNTLRDLKLEYALTEGGAKFQIPRMKRLKKLTLCGSIGDYSNPREVCHLFKFIDGTSGKKNYFPSLLTVRIDVGPASIKASLASFFHDAPENVFSNVDILEMSISHLDKRWLKNFKLNFTIFSKALPNLRMIKFECDQIRHLRGSLWMLHSLEFIEIYNISRNHKAPSDFRSVPFVDKFFTGFGIDLCHKLETNKLPKHMDNPRTLKFLQVRPSVCDLPKLKELKLKFSADFSVQFASKVTADYAFSKMPNTKFIVSYDPDKINKTADLPTPKSYDSDDSSSSDDWGLEKGSDSEDDYIQYRTYGTKSDDGSDADEDEELPVFGNIEIKEYSDEKEKYEELCFGPIKPYVQIAREKQY